MRPIALAFALCLIAPAAWAIQYASIVIDARTGKVLHAVNPDERAYPASLTKMMTLYLTFEALRDGRLTLDQKLKVSAHAQSRSPSKLGLKRGETITVKDAIAALVTKSANDVATVVGEALGGTEARFAELMTAKARQLGMTRTTFRNASGLPNRSQVSTARDMAKLSVAVQRDFPQFYGYFSLQTFDYRGQSYRNHNRLLTRYNGTDGIKTGYVHESGFNIAVSAERDNHRLIAVVLGGRTAATRDRHAIALLDKAFNALAEAPVVADAAPAAKATPAAAGGQQAASVTLARVKPAAATEDEAEIGGGWSIQVGAFNRFAPAHLAASRAMRKVPSLAGSRISVVPGEGDEKQLFRARLVGFTEADAREGCRKLKRQKVGCLVVKNASEVETAEGDR